MWAFAHVMRGARIGADCNIGGHSFVEDGATIGERVTLKNGVMVWRGVTIGDDAFIGPGVVFTNDRHPRSPRTPTMAGRYREEATWLEPTSVGHGASIGARSVILCGLTIGRYAVVGAGSVVTQDVPEHRIVLGNPALPVGWACRCGQRLAGGNCCRSCEARYELGATGLRPVESATGLQPLQSSDR